VLYLRDQYMFQKLALFGVFWQRLEYSFQIKHFPQCI